MRYLLLITAFFFISLTVQAKSSYIKEEAQALSRLKKRKKSYEKFKKSLRQRDVKRLAAIGKQKKLRKKYRLKRERARTKFKREVKKIPAQAYKKFKIKRDKQRKRIEDDRKNYVRMRQKLERLHNKSRFKIDKMEEYQL